MRSTSVPRRITRPKFDGNGKKIAHAKFVKVVLNGELIHENQEVEYPTGNNWKNKQVPTGPLLLQGEVIASYTLFSSKGSSAACG